MSDENSNEFAPEIDNEVVNQFDESEEEFDDEEFDDVDDQDSHDEDEDDSDAIDDEIQSSDVAPEVETATAFDSAIAEVSDYLDVVSTDSALALFALPTTGEPRVDDALGRLGDLESLPVHEHVEVFEDVQRRLHDTLADLAGS
ncbi:MAG: hypothetical protein EBS15_00210 [Actinobacteria bacterium]|nr:hypothetical protein [Actinomycetota bacterium]